MESLEQKNNKDPIQISLSSLSDQEFTSTYHSIQSLIRNDPNYKVETLVNTVDTKTVQALGDMLDETIARNIYPEIENKDIGILSDTFEENIKNWNMYQKEVLDFTLLVKIVQNINYVSQNITYEHLKRVYQGKYTCDLVYIWLSSVREKLLRKTNDIEF